MADTILMMKNATDTFVVKGHATQSENLQEWQDTSTNIKASISKEGYITPNSRILGKEGTNVASANDITLGDGNFFSITGTTEIQRILRTGWTNGSMIIFKFNDNITVKNGVASGGGYDGFVLAGSSDFSAKNGDNITFIYDNVWREISRTVV